MRYRSIPFYPVYLLIFLFFLCSPALAQIDPQLQTRLQQAPIIVNHTHVALYDQIPQIYKDRAAFIPMVFSDRSVGFNLHGYLDCLETPSSQAASFCKVNHTDSRYTVDPSILQWTSTADRSNWSFEFRGNDWHGLTQNFITDIIPTYQNTTNVLSFQFSYLNIEEAGLIAPNNPSCPYWPQDCGGFLVERPDRANRYDVSDLLAFESAHPDKAIIYWTTSYARNLGNTIGRDFNDQMRSFAAERHKILFDFADITSHTPDGQPCYDNRDGVPYTGTNGSENFPDDGLNLPAICPHYTSEWDGGHLGSPAAGGILAARGLWVVMAQIAGWQPNVSASPTPTVTPAPVFDFVDFLNRVLAFGTTNSGLNLTGTALIDIFDLNAVMRNL